MSAPRDEGTTGHAWDGIEELNTPLPRWWVWVFYATIAWGLAYTVLYPAWPLLASATGGVLGWSSRGEVAADIAGADAGRADLLARLAATPPSAVAADPELQAFALRAGAAVFRSNCATCHGAGAGGVQAGGYPSLLDDDWLWGGTMDDLVATISHGVRNDAAEARWSQMPAFGGILARGEIDAVVEHVLAVSGQEHDAALAAEGSELFAANCAGCHGADARGGREVGAPNLADAIWLYGGSRETIRETVREARFGVMPAWSEADRPGGLTAGEIAAVAAYVHALGGGE